MHSLSRHLSRPGQKEGAEDLDPALTDKGNSAAEGAGWHLSLTN